MTSPPFTSLPAHHPSHVADIEGPSLKAWLGHTRRAWSPALGRDNVKHVVVDILASFWAAIRPPPPPSRRASA